jgi:hypothetical protein
MSPIDMALIRTGDRGQVRLLRDGLAGPSDAAMVQWANLAGWRAGQEILFTRARLVNAALPAKDAELVAVRHGDPVMSRGTVTMGAMVSRAVE